MAMIYLQAYKRLRNSKQKKCSTNLEHIIRIFSMSLYDPNSVTDNKAKKDSNLYKQLG